MLYAGSRRRAATDGRGDRRTRRAEGATGGGPTVLRILLGAHLRRLREAQGVSREDAGWEIRSSESKISRMELGRVGFKERDVADLLTLYGVDDDEERERLLALARDANNPGWWHRYGDVLPGWFQSYLGLEAAASLIRTLRAAVRPRVCCRPRTTRARWSCSATRRAGRGGRARGSACGWTASGSCTGPSAPQLWAVVDEAVLRRPIGGAERDAGPAGGADRGDRSCRNVTAAGRCPFNVGGHAAAGGAFSILRFPERDLPDVVYVEQLTSALYLDKREDVDHYAAAMERLCVAGRAARGHPGTAPRGAGRAR